MLNYQTPNVPSKNKFNEPHKRKKTQNVISVLSFSTVKLSDAVINPE